MAAAGVKGVIRGSKDAALAFAVRRLLNARLVAIGEITDASIDTAHRRAQLRLALRGEREAIDVELGKYRLESTDDGEWLTLADAVGSREWLTAALRQFVVGRRFQISKQTAAALRLLA